jgi:hypothetical protein
MALVQQIITFSGSAATQIAPAGTYVTEVFVEPLRANTAGMYVGNSSLTQNGSAGCISDLYQPASSPTILDRFQLNAKGGSHNYDAGTLYVWGTTSQGCKVTYWTM